MTKRKTWKTKNRRLDREVRLKELRRQKIRAIGMAAVDRVIKTIEAEQRAARCLALIDRHVDLQ